MSPFFKSIIDPLKESASVKSVYGDPVSAHGKTIIPVARISYGFGGGSGKGEREGRPGEGEGGGGGVMAAPAGVVEITGEGTRFIAFHDKRKLLAVGLAGFCLGLLWAKRVKRPTLPK